MADFDATRQLMGKHDRPLLRCDTCGGHAFIGVPSGASCRHPACIGHYAYAAQGEPVRLRCGKCGVFDESGRGRQGDRCPRMVHPAGESCDGTLYADAALPHAFMRAMWCSACKCYVRARPGDHCQWCKGPLAMEETDASGQQQAAAPDGSRGVEPGPAKSEGDQQAGGERVRPHPGQATGEGKSGEEGPSQVEQDALVAWGQKALDGLYPAVPNASDVVIVVRMKGGYNFMMSDVTGASAIEMLRSATNRVISSTIEEIAEAMFGPRDPEPKGDSAKPDAPLH